MVAKVQVAACLLLLLLADGHAQDIAEDKFAGVLTVDPEGQVMTLRTCKLHQFDFACFFMHALILSR
jgi:hypothetical protein